MVSVDSNSALVSDMMYKIVILLAFGENYVQKFPFYL